MLPVRIVSLLGRAHGVTYSQHVKKYFNPVWILRGFIGASTVPLTYAYFLLESKSAESYTLALSNIKTAAPLFNPPNFMVDFKTSEHRAITLLY